MLDLAIFILHQASAYVKRSNEAKVGSSQEALPHKIVWTLKQPILSTVLCLQELCLYCLESFLLISVAVFGALHLMR